MKLKVTALSVFTVTIFILDSCAPAYVPNVINAPMLTNKREVQLALHAGTAGFDPQFAYAITNHLGVMLNGSFMNSTSDSTNNYHKHGFGELGLGYFMPIGQRGKFEAFGGVGSGKIQALYENSLWTSRSNVSITRYFIQPTIGITSKLIDAGFSTRISIVNLHNYAASSTGIFAEPAITAKLGWDHLKVVGQLGISVPFDSENNQINYQPLLISLGIQGNFGKVFK
jgi:hypothetical protein